MFYVDYEDESIRKEIPVDEVNHALASITERLGLQGSFSLTFVTDQRIQQLNREYRGKDEPTDILTFALNDGEAFPTVDQEEQELGDVFISLEAMRRNAVEFNVDEREELYRLLVHGCLHLMGEDHATNDFKTEPMLVLQEKILVELGFFKC